MPSHGAGKDELRRVYDIDDMPLVYVAPGNKDGFNTALKYPMELWSGQHACHAVKVICEDGTPPLRAFIELYSKKGKWVYRKEQGPSKQKAFVWPSDHLQISRICLTTEPWIWHPGTPQGFARARNCGFGAVANLQDWLSTELRIRRSDKFPEFARARNCGFGAMANLQDLPEHGIADSAFWQIPRIWLSTELRIR